ncbi:DPH4-like protein [Forsythia ovata]|uniref:DPH4-like protein n=1 Tax=Forsythia ovata TaxID=205694 RepID=A0ABD1U7G5_9LAMI
MALNWEVSADVLPGFLVVYEHSTRMWYEPKGGYFNWNSTSQTGTIWNRSLRVSILIGIRPLKPEPFGIGDSDHRSLRTPSTGASHVSASAPAINPVKVLGHQFTIARFFSTSPIQPSLNQSCSSQPLNQLPPQSIIVAAKASKLLRYPLRFATKPKEEKPPLVDSSNSSAHKREKLASSVSKSVGVLDLSDKKPAKPPRRQSVSSKPTASPAPRTIVQKPLFPSQNPPFSFSTTLPLILKSDSGYPSNQSSTTANRQANITSQRAGPTTTPPEKLTLKSLRSYLLQNSSCSAMIQSGNLTNKTHYEILDVKEDASFEEIRACYRSSILSFHPDKMLMTSETSNPEQESGSKFLEVQRAWEILGDPKSRGLYDNELQSLRHDSATAEDIRLEDLSIKDADNVFELSYDCRCGDYFVIDSSELADMGYPLLKNGSKIYLQAPRSLPASVVLPCGSCSLKVQLLINADSKLQTELSN